jgi:hypothetical protein
VTVVTLIDVIGIVLTQSTRWIYAGSDPRPVREESDAALSACTFLPLILGRQSGLFAKMNPAGAGTVLVVLLVVVVYEVDVVVVVWSRTSFLVVVSVKTILVQLLLG